MAATTSSVRVLLGSDYNDVDLASIAPHLSAAELVVSEDLAVSGLTPERKELIVNFLAAHFAVISFERGGLTRQKVGESTDTYKEGSNSDRGYLMTRFGQQAVALDTSGTLALNANPTQKAEFRVV